MLGVIAAPDAGIDAGLVGLLMARRWCVDGQRTLLIDADTTGGALAQRLGSAMQAEYLPTERGLPSLIASQELLSLELLADHCYSLDRASGLRWVLFAPGHPDGAEYAVGWLAQHHTELMEIDRQRCIIVAGPLADDSETTPLLLKLMSGLVLLAHIPTLADAKTLRQWCERRGLLDDLVDSPTSLAVPLRTVLAVVGATELADEELREITMLTVAGHLPAVDDAKLLQMCGSRRDQKAMRKFNNVFEFCSHMAGLHLGLAKQLKGQKRSMVRERLVALGLLEA